MRIINYVLQTSLFVMIASRCFGSEAPQPMIVSILSSNAAPYAHAAASIRSEVASAGMDSSELLLGDIEKSESPDRLKNELTEKFLVAIGSKAAGWIRKHLPNFRNYTYCLVANPEKLELFSQFDVDGFSTVIPLGLQLDLISDVLPSVIKVGTLYRGTMTDHEKFLNNVRGACTKRDWDLITIDLDNYQSTSRAIKKLFQQEIDIVWTSPDSRIYNPTIIRALLLESVRRRLPVYGFSSPFVKAGALLGMTIDVGNQGRFVGKYAIRRIVNSTLGEPTTLISVDQQEELFQFAINLVVAQKFNLNISEDVIERATTVYRP